MIPLLLLSGDLPPLPQDKTGMALYIMSALAMFLTGLWNRRGTKAVENKTDGQTMVFSKLLIDVLGEVKELRGAHEDMGRSTKLELADHGVRLTEYKARLDGHDKRLERLETIEKDRK